MLFNDRLAHGHLRTPLSLLLLAGPAVAAPQGFVDRTEELGLEHRTLTGLDTADNVGVTGKIARDWVNVGLATADIDGDGDPDVVACGALLDNTVLRNDGGTFVDVTAAAGINTGELDRCAALVDYDLDGDFDLFIGAHEGNGIGGIPPRSRLYRNDGTGVFEDVTVLSATFGNGRTVHGYWHDLDLDGLPDLYTSEFNLTPNHWYRNNGDGTFTELASQLGIDSAGNTHVASAVDTDQDGQLDLIVSNDYLVGASLEFPIESNPGEQYFHGQPDGTFDDISGPVNMDHPKGIMGLTFGDVDYDGDLDVYKSNIQNNLLCINNGAPGSGIQWVLAQEEYGIDNELLPFPGKPGEMGASVGWGVHFMNANFDRWLDLFVVNGHVAAMNYHEANMPKPQVDTMYVGLGPDDAFAFEDATVALGMQYYADERGSVVADFDQDGDTDILVTSASGPLHYLENQVDRQGQGAIRVAADTRTSAPHGIGTVLRWTDSEGYPHIRVIGADSPTASQSEYEVEFGLGLEPSADIVAEFPSGMIVSYLGVPPDTRLVVQEPEMIRLSTRKMGVLGSGMGAADVEVTVFAHAANGTPLDGTAAVSIDIPGLIPVAPLQHVAGNEFTRTFRSSLTPGAYRVDVNMQGFRPNIRPHVFVVGPPHAGRSTVRTVPEAVRAGSADTFEVWVAPKDASGVASGPGLTVTVATNPPLEALGPVVDHGDGRYSVSFPAPPTPGVIQFAVSANGFAITNLPTVDAGGPADGATTEYRFEQAHPPQAMSPYLIPVVVTPRDAGGRRLGPNAPVSLRLSVVDTAAPRGGPGSVGGAPDASPAGSIGAGAIGSKGQKVWVSTEFGDTGQRDGDFLFMIEKTPPLTFLPSGYVDILWNDQVIATHPFTYEPQQF